MEKGFLQTSDRDKLEIGSIQKSWFNCSLVICFTRHGTSFCLFKELGHRSKLTTFLSVLQLPSERRGTQTGPESCNCKRTWVI